MDETKDPVDNDQKGDDKRSKGGGSKVVPKTKTERTEWYKDWQILKQYV